MLRNFRVSRKWGFEAVVDFHLIPSDEFVGFVGHADYGLQFLEHFRGHAFAKSGSGVGGDTVAAIVCHTHGDVNEFFGERVDGTGSHDFLEAFPRTFQEPGIVSDGFPKIIDPISFAGGHDVVIDGANFRIGIVIFDERKCRHASSERRIVRRYECKASRMRGNNKAGQIFNIKTI